jgi:hypothetical protein
MSLRCRLSVCYLFVCFKGEVDPQIFRRIRRREREKRKRRKNKQRHEIKRQTSLSSIGREKAQISATILDEICLQPQPACSVCCVWLDGKSINYSSAVFREKASLNDF